MILFLKVVFFSIASLFSNQKLDSKVIDLIMFGEYEMLSENYQEAESYFLQALELDSNSITIFLNLAEINLKSNNIADYSFNINQAFLLDTTNIEIGLINANLCLINEKHIKSEKILLGLFNQYPLNTNIQIALLEFYQLTKRWQDLIILYIELFSNDIKQESFLMNALDISLATGNENLVINKLKILLLKYPENKILLSSYLQIIYNNQLYDHAESTLKELININNSIKLKKQLAEIYVLLSDFKKSKELLEKVIGSEPLDKYLYGLLSITFTNLDEFNNLLIYSDQFIRLYPDIKDGYENKIIALLQLKQYNDLIRFSDLSKKYFPQEVIFTYVLGDAYYSMGDYLNAEKEYLNALKLSKDSRLIKNSLITIYELKNEYKKSDSLFKELMIEDSNDALTLNNYAFSLIERKNINFSIIEYALELSKKSLEIEPANAAFLDTLGWIYYRMENYNLAENFIKDSIAIDNTNAVVLEHLADVYIKKNNVNDALIYYKLALKNDPNNVETKLKIKKYEKN